jgi:hypothetical protein
VFPVKYKISLHIKKLSYPRNKHWKAIDVFPVRNEQRILIKSKAISVTGRGYLYGCGMSRSSHFLENGLIDGGVLIDD